MYNRSTLNNYIGKPTAISLNFSKNLLAESTEKYLLFQMYLNKYFFPNKYIYGTVIDNCIVDIDVTCFFILSVSKINKNSISLFKLL